VTRLAPSAHTAAALAVKQCLVNVLKHSGTDVAEVVVYGSDSEVSIMVIDAGRGFSERETSVDRLGLRQSVRRRIEAVDGSVQVWSTPGMGTSVLMRVPTQHPSAVPEDAQ
jgi:signal transduction histidine kinase